MNKRIGILFFMLLFAPILQGQQQPESILEKVISIDRENQPVAIILNELSQKAGIFFSYDASVIVSDRLVSIDVKDTKIEDVLNLLFDKNLFRFIAKEGHIIILLKENGSLPDTTNQNYKQEPFINLTGRVVNQKTRKPIRYANISIVGKPIGTISNTDGDFILKVGPENKNELIAFSCLGYLVEKIPVDQIKPNDIILLKPASIFINEVLVNPISPEMVLDKALENINANYFTQFMMTEAFYRETVKQDNDYINVSEAVLQILKSPYNNLSRDDKVHILKGRKIPEVNPLQWIDFKLQGGPKTITQLDLVKMTDTFLDPRFRNLYSYEINRVIWYQGHPVYVIRFKPIRNVPFLCYEGEIYVDRETFAIWHINFGLDKQGLKLASKLLIKKKPRGFKIRTIKADYVVDYRQFGNKFYFSSARASLIFKIKDRSEKINSLFQSTSELLITDLEQSQIRRFPRNQAFLITDIFTETIDEYDDEFWGNYNIIKPGENLVKALKNFRLKK